MTKMLVVQMADDVELQPVLTALSGMLASLDMREAPKLWAAIAERAD